MRRSSSDFTCVTPGIARCTGKRSSRSVQKNRSLETLYHQEMGKVHARTYSPQLRDMGLSGVWFAILEGVTIASGTTRQEVEQAVQRIVPQHKLPFIYTFQVKGAAHRRGAKPSESP